MSSGRTNLLHTGHFIPGIDREIYKNKLFTYNIFILITSDPANVVLLYIKKKKKKSDHLYYIWVLNKDIIFSISPIEHHSDRFWTSTYNYKFVCRYKRCVLYPKI